MFPLNKTPYNVYNVSLFTFQAENEEFISIYQRPAGLSLTVPEDFDSFSMEDAELEVG